MNGRNRWTMLAGAAALAGCSSMNRTESGATVGGLVGAGAGALIGDAAGGKAGKGALIGGAVGALSGAVVGKSEDKAEAREVRAASQAHALSLQEVVQMTQQGLSEDIVCNQIRANGCGQRLTASDLAYLKQANVSDRVILELQQSAARPVVVARPGPVIVERPYYYGPGPYYYGPRHYYGPPPAVGQNFEFSRRR